MDKNDFQVDGHYAVTLKDENGKLRAANIYVHSMENDYMIVRRTSGGDVGLLLKLPYEDVVKIARTHRVLDPKKFMVPAALLKPKLWEGRDSMRAYSSAPGLGK